MEKLKQNLKYIIIGSATLSLTFIGFKLVKRNNFIARFLIKSKYPRIKTVNNQKKPEIETLGNFNGVLFNSYNPDFKIKIKDKDKLLTILEKIKQDGLEELQIISDFDWTISSFNLNKKKNLTIYDMFKESPLVSERFKQLYNDLKNHYAPKENDPNLTEFEREKLMEEWYNRVKVEGFLKENLSKQKCTDIVNYSNIALRYGFDRFLFLCKKINLPFYLISGGISNIIATVLNNCVDITDYENMFIFSNVFEFKQDEEVKNLNLNVYAAKKYKILNPKDYKLKKNSIVIGDLLSDCQMATLTNTNVLGIAFLNEDNQHLLNDYLEKFDIVMVGEADFLLIDYIIRYLGKIPQNLEFKEKMERNEAFWEFMSIFEGKIYTRKMKKTYSRVVFY